jgi:hypothetical protein
MLNFCPSRNGVRSFKLRTNLLFIYYFLKNALIGAQMAMSLRGGLDSDNVPNGSKLIENSQPRDKEVTKGENNVKDHQTSRSAIYTLVSYFQLLLVMQQLKSQ